jgi:hypothetical protein
MIVHKCQFKLEGLVIKLYEKLKLPIWHNDNIQCITDADCPVPFACCHDAFFPTKDSYCCSNYKKRDYEYKYSYVYNN